MTSKRHRAYFALFVSLVAPIGAAVVVTDFLLFGVKPRAVFVPGWALLALLRSLGIHAPYSVGVAGTVGLWWLLLVLLGSLWEWRRTRSAT